MGSHMVVRDWPPDLAIKEIDFSFSPFWIRICGLSPNQMTKLNAEKIAGKIGKLKEIDFTTNGKISWYRYLRIRVEIDVRKPLHPGFNRNKNHQSKAWIHLHYERLPDFCFNCGKLGHVIRLCPSPPLEKPQNCLSPFGPWMRADYSEATPLEVEWNPITSYGENPNQLPYTTTLQQTSSSQSKTPVQNSQNPVTHISDSGCDRNFSTDWATHSSDSTLPKKPSPTKQPLSDTETSHLPKNKLHVTPKPPTSGTLSIHSHQPPYFFPNLSLIKMLESKAVMIELTAGSKEYDLPVSGKVSMNIIISSPVRPDKKQIRGSCLASCKTGDETTEDE
ncbi:hypothetical protein RJ640_004288 [Escallonia rubra]|uniref:CCHC-type domain-containing protein n=1 Tax=Escallonia rubra TaxID=112253 RepID=A0AA88QV12_9ASTE|nr:hypothetical protein RJ640_004288 [Escallonia rubra]